MLAQEESQSDAIQWIQPSNDNQGDSDNDERERERDHVKKEVKKPTLTRQSSFDIIKTGATRIMNPKNKKRMETCLLEHGDSEGLQTILAARSNDEDEQNWIQPGTTAEEEDTTEMGRSSILEGIKDTISETLHHLHMPHHTKDGVMKDNHGLLGTAMETMLMEQATIMGAQSAADPVESVKIEERRNSSIESFKKLLVAPFRRRSNDSNDVKLPRKESKKEKFSLFDSAMKTMLNETAHIIEGVGVHPKSFDQDDAKPIEQTNPTSEWKRDSIPRMKQPEAIDENVDGESECKPSDSNNDKNVESGNAPQSYSKFCDNLTMSHVLTNDDDVGDNESTLSAAGNCQSTSEMPVFVLTKCSSKQNKTSAKPIDPNIHIDKSNLTPDNAHHDRVPSDNKTISPKPMRKSNNLNVNPMNNLSRPLIHSHSGDLINQTNKTKLLAPDPYPKHRSQDDKCIPVNASANKHTRAESSGTKTQSSPTKVPTSSSSYNTSTAACATATSNLSSSKGKDGKEETICRRSSDSDLSVTPKGNAVFTIQILFTHQMERIHKLLAPLPLSRHKASLFHST